VASDNKEWGQWTWLHILAKSLLSDLLVTWHLQSGVECHSKTPYQRYVGLSGCSGVVVEYRTRNREVAGSTHTRSTASNFEQVVNLLCAQVNSASYPQRDGKWVVATATRWKPGVADWGGAIVCLLAALWVQLSVSAWNSQVTRCGTIGQSAAMHFRDCKALPVTSLTRVSGAWTCVQIFTFLPFIFLHIYASASYARWRLLCLVFSISRCPDHVPCHFFRFARPTERISMKIMRGNHYDQQID